MQNAYRAVPSVDKLLGQQGIKRLEGEHSRPAVLQLVRSYLDEVRSAIDRGAACPALEDMVRELSRRGEELGRSSLQRVINASGVVLHTNLGRAPLSRDAIAAMRAAAQGYTNLELDLESGKRSSRQVHVESLLCRLTTAEAALAVNNNAAAVLLALAALARGKEVIVSRGQAVEIGGGFRIPEVMRQSGARLVEVGTTNRTYLSDYEQAITPRTAALLRVHSSNFRVVGFTASPALAELVRLGNERGIPVLDDLGSGCLLDTARFGLEHEPTVQESMADGAALAFLSGDKLLGGPQAGIIAGRSVLVEKARRHPLARAVRIDKVALAGLAATLLHYARGEAESKVPVWQMISLGPDDIKARAEAWARALPASAGAEVVAGESVAGGGSLPGGTLPTWLVAVRLGRPGFKDLPQRLRRPRLGAAPILGRVERNMLLLDPRTVLTDEDDALLESLREALAEREDAAGKEV